jgi:hypothetical protein
MFSIKIKIDCFNATLCSINIVTDKLIIIIYCLIYFKIMLSKMLPRWEKKKELIRMRQVEERNRLKRTFKFLDFIESPKIDMVSYLLERINDDAFSNRNN